MHWPFCASKCPYCDFNSHVRAGGIDEDAFVEAYLREFNSTAGWIGPRATRSVFFGGGTPSLMRPASVAAILDEIDRLWPVAAGAEITLEANPSSVEAGRFAGYRTAGVNRVSLGVQSLDDAELARLGRRHSVAEARAAIAVAKSTFGRVSFDLIYARPGQTPAAWRSELAEALRIADKHLSLYQLTIEPDTPFAELHRRGKLVVPDPEAALALYEVTQELTEARGLPAYEISNHAAFGEESRHNLLYWRYGEYAGIGPGAHGRLIFEGARIATAAERQPERWAALVGERGHGRVEATALSREDMFDEALLMGLRLAEGLDLDRLESLTGLRPSSTAIARLEAAGMVERTGNARLIVRREGRFVLNAIVLALSRSRENANLSLSSRAQRSIEAAGRQ